LQDLLFGVVNVFQGVEEEIVEILVLGGHDVLHFREKGGDVPASQREAVRIVPGRESRRVRQKCHHPKRGIAMLRQAVNARSPMLQPRLFNPSGMAFSIATHLTVLAVGFGYAGVRPFQATPVEAIAVDIVPVEELKQAAPGSKPPLDIADRSTSELPAAPSPSKALP